MTNNIGFLVTIKGYLSVFCLVIVLLVSNKLIFSLPTIALKTSGYFKRVSHGATESETPIVKGFVKEMKDDPTKTDFPSAKLQYRACYLSLM